jgi:hypothetical protein
MGMSIVYIVSLWWKKGMSMRRAKKEDHVASRRVSRVAVNAERLQHPRLDRHYQQLAIDPSE